MRHFEEERWARFARGVVEDPERAVMEDHVSSGCLSCLSILSASRRAVDLLDRWGAHAAHSWAPTIETRRGGRSRAAEWLQSLSRIPARVVYERVSGPRPPGTSGLHYTIRQAVFEAGDYAVNLRVDCDPDSGRRVVVGQVGSRSVPPRPLAYVPVWLLSGRAVAARTVSNERGQFQLEYEADGRLRLALPVDSVRRIELPLARLGESAP
jgi:hypothetical protein